MSHIFSFNIHYNAMMEKVMAPHSNTVAWKIPWMEEPGGLQSMESLIKSISVSDRCVSSPT